MKTKTVYVCSECGYEANKWLGRCPSCNTWNSLIEEVRAQTADAKGKGRESRPVATEAVTLHEVESIGEPRIQVGIGELDRVLGGGLVRGSIALLTGDPGIGKSTILLQMCQTVGLDTQVLYISGEESPRQIAMRAERLGVDSPNLILAGETDIENIVALAHERKPDILIVDSIQTMCHPALSSAAGSVSQVRECTGMLMQLAKRDDISVFVVGHVNKDGAIAGPKVLEHIVDTVLYLEGERHLAYRILRAVKNRFGSTNEIGVFEMTDKGLCEVMNPSLALLSGRPVGVSGNCVGCVIEGSRPLLTEVQALVAKTPFAAPRRTAAGFDYNRMQLLVAILEKRAGFQFGSFDIFLNIVGGLRLIEPAADLAAIIALASGYRDIAVGHNVVVFGEMGLAGEVRAVSHAAQRVAESGRLGFSKCILPAGNNASSIPQPDGMELVYVKSLFEALGACGII